MMENFVIHDPKELEGSYTAFLLLSVFAAVSGGTFQFGYHLGNVNTPQAVIEQFFVDSHRHLFNDELTISQVARFQWAIAVGIFAIGGIIGGLLSGKVADYFGRKRALMLNAVIADIAAILLTISKYTDVYILFIIGRFVIGIASGISSGTVPMYLTEISPINLRGSLGSIAQLSVTIAILIAQILGLPQLLGTPTLWPIIYALTVVPATIQLCVFPFCPESPKYTLLVKNQLGQAEKDLKKLREKNDVSAEIVLLCEEKAQIARSQQVSIAGVFHEIYLWPMFLAIMLMIAQQLSGINVVMFYSTSIFRNAGMGDNAVYATLVMGFVNVATTVISVYLVDHPKCGRVILLLIGFSGMWLATILLVIFISIHHASEESNQWSAYPSCVFVFLFVLSFGIGPGSIPWFYVSELFTSGARGAAISVAVMVNWTFTFIVATSFEFLNTVLRQFVFLIFTAILTIFIIFIWLYVPETKGRSVEDIYEEFKRGKTRFTRSKK